MVIVFEEAKERGGEKMAETAPADEPPSKKVARGNGKFPKEEEKGEEEGEDTEIRKALITFHEQGRARILKQHSNELLEFDTECARQLGEGFDTCAYVRNARADNVKKMLNGLCSVCKKVAGVTACKYCDMGVQDQQLKSTKCASCKWTDNGGLVCSKADHGFCASCVSDLQEEGEAEQHDIPYRENRHPDFRGERVEREHLHPFHICDCECCAWCGEDDYAVFADGRLCCVDHEDQDCSCFPQMD